MPDSLTQLIERDGQTQELVAMRDLVVHQVPGASDGDHVRRMDLVHPRKCRAGHNGSNRTPPVFDDIVAHIVRTKAAVQPCINTRGNTANAAKEPVRNVTQ